MRCLFILLGCLSFSSPAKSQENEKDSLLLVISSSVPDSVKSDALNELAFYMFDYNVDSSVLLATQARKMAIKAGSVRQEARAIKNIGICYDIWGKTDSAILYLTEALVLARKHQLHPSQANILTDIGNAWYAAGIYELALRNHFEALQLREGYKARKEIAQSYNNIALIYRSRKEYAAAVKYNQLSLQIKTELNNKQGIINSSINIGSCYQYMGNYDSALHYAVKVEKDAFVPQDIHEGKANLATALLGLRRFDEAKVIFNELLPQLNTAEEQAAYISCHQGLGMIASAEKKIQQAIEWFTKGAEYARRYNDRESVAAFYKLLAETFARQNDFDKAYQFSSRYELLKDSLLNEENSRQINEMNAVYEKEKQQQQIGMLTNQVSTTEQKAEKNRQLLVFFLLSTVLGLLLAGVIFYTYVINKRKNAILITQKQDIENALKEKEVLMREIHHRVKNNLQVVTSLLNLQSHYISDEKAYSAVQAGKSRVQSMALIHQFLYRDVSNLTSLRIKDYIRELLAYLEDTNSKETLSVSIIQQVEDVELDIDTVVPLGLIINELVTNAYKYAFADRSEGIIRVSFTRQADTGGYLLRVADNGAGMSEALTLEKSRSFGYRMIRAFTEKLEGKLTIDIENGTVVSLYIPATKNETV
ncbi:MAG: tetratricopeptide repeat protein [Bacteroidetes bacterium]|nr:tetratricopeptide repeat protein [Bacteroidota bacterium]